MIHCPWWTKPKGEGPEITQCLEASRSLCHISSLECSTKDANVSLHSILRSSFCFFLQFKLHFFWTCLRLQAVIQVSWRPNKYETEWDSFLSLFCFCFDHTIPWHIHRQLFNSSWSGPSLIGARRNKSKQETGLVPKQSSRCTKNL